MADTFSKMNRDVTAPVGGVSATPRVFFKQSHQLGQITYFV